MLYEVITCAESYTRTLKLMGSRFDITVVAENEDEGNRYIDMAVAEISRIEKIISSWDANSQTSEINSNSGIHPVVVDQELFQLIERALAISRLTDGAFDISYASIVITSYSIHYTKLYEEGIRILFNQLHHSSLNLLVFLMFILFCHIAQFDL